MGAVHPLTAKMDVCASCGARADAHPLEWCLRLLQFFCPSCHEGVCPRPIKRGAATTGGPT